MFEELCHFIFGDDTKKALERSEGIEHLWLFVWVWVNSFLLLEKSLSLKLVRVQLDGESLLNTQNLKEKGKVLKIMLF